MSHPIPNERRSLNDGADRKPHITDTGIEPGLHHPQTGVHPAVIGIGLAAAFWFIAVTWISFARGTEVEWDLVVVTLFFAFFFALFLFTASHALNDPRWHQRDTSFREFLKSEVGTATGPMSGREVLLEIAVMPVSLALAATLIGLVWIAMH